MFRTGAGGMSQGLRVLVLVLLAKNCADVPASGALVSFVVPPPKRAGGSSKGLSTTMKAMAPSIADITTGRATMFASLARPGIVDKARARLEMQAVIRPTSLLL